MRFAAALSLPLVLAVLAGCAPGANGELRTLVDGVAPVGRSTVECEWGSNYGSDAAGEVKSYYGCAWLVRGKPNRVSRALRSRLAARGFFVTCRQDAKTIELSGTRGANTVDVNVLAPGVVVSPDLVVPPRHVYVVIAAQELAGAGPAVTAIGC
jgi:hypothetical protein